MVRRGWGCALRAREMRHAPSRGVGCAGSAEIGGERGEPRAICAGSGRARDAVRRDQLATGVGGAVCARVSAGACRAVCVGRRRRPPAAGDIGGHEDHDVMSEKHEPFSSICCAPCSPAAAARARLIVRLRVAVERSTRTQTTAVDTAGYVLEQMLLSICRRRARGRGLHVMYRHLVQCTWEYTTDEVFDSYETLSGKLGFFPPGDPVRPRPLTRPLIPRIFS